MTDSFDVIVIGSGPGGYVCAIRAAQLGLKTACIEASATLGGTCLNVGCIPSKALLESSHLYHVAKHDFAQHGISAQNLEFNVKKMVERKDSVVDSITKGVEFLFKKNQVTWLKGRAVLKSATTVLVEKDGNTVEYGAKNIVIATGSTPIEIPSVKFDHRYILDSSDALKLESVPDHLIVIGGGVIGLELGSVWLRLGSKVTVIEAADKILGATDNSVSLEMQKILKKQGMEFHLSTTLQEAEIKGNRVHVVCAKGPERIVFECDKLLVAVGRRPYTDRLGLEAVGIEKDARGRIPVTSDFKSKIAGIYAIGDVIAGPMLAHKAEEEGIAVAENIAGKCGHVNYDAIPSVVYTWPEIATVGKSEEELTNAGMSFKKSSFPFKANGRAKAMGNVDGFVKILADSKTDRLLGVHIIGPMASELIAEVAIAFEYKASAEDLARSIHAHPTLAEAIKEAALGIDGRTIHA
jgi:dihydrolipoamide dehydrogenase